MILSLTQPNTHNDNNNNDFFPRSAHVQEPYPQFSDRNYDLPRSAPPIHHRSQDSTHSSDSYAMSNSHRGLPPPSSMTLPDPVRQPPILSQSQSLGSIPAPPAQWNGAEESMRNWLATKAEEDRRKQEEERTRQESLRLEQRRVEHSMLRESMQGGVPPHMIPIIFAGIAGHPSSYSSAEWLHHFATQPHDPLAHAYEARREQPQYAPLHSAPPVPPPPQQPQYSGQTNPFPAYTVAPGPAPPTGPTSAPRTAAYHGLSRLNTVDLRPTSSAQGPPPPPPLSSSQNQPPQPQTQRQTSPQQQQQQQQQQEQTTSPSIHFHHWMPPATQETKGAVPPTPSHKEPSSAHPSHGGDAEYSSPRKRKATGGHQPLPAPSQISPSLVHQANTRRSQQQTHARSRSNKSDERADSDRREQGTRRDSVAATTRSADEHRFSRDAGWTRPAGSSPRRDTR